MYSSHFADSVQDQDQDQFWALVFIRCVVVLFTVLFVRMLLLDKANQMSRGILILCNIFEGWLACHVRHTFFSGCGDEPDPDSSGPNSDPKNQLCFVCFSYFFYVLK